MTAQRAQRLTAVRRGSTLHAALTAVVALCCLVATQSPAVASELPMRINQLAIEGWISPMWEPVAAVGGLLDDDDLEDVALVLHRHSELPGDDLLLTGSRALAIFTLDEQGDYLRAALAEEFLPCVKCLGTFNLDPAASPFDIEIEDRRLSIGWISNERGLVAVRLTLAWSPEHLAYVLVRDEIARADRTRAIRSRRIRDYVAGTETLNGETRSIEPRVIPIEEVKARDYQ